MWRARPSHLKTRNIRPRSRSNPRRAAIRARTDASSDYRAAAIRALAQTGNRDYISQLEGIAFAPDSSRGMQEAAKQAINQLLGRQLYPIR